MIATYENSATWKCNLLFQTIDFSEKIILTWAGIELGSPA